MRVTVSGLAAGETATLQVSASRTITLTLDSRCAPTGARSGACTASEPTTTFTFVAAVAPRGGGTIQLRVTPTTGRDPHPSDNTATVHLQG